jgi:hypothetical protein
MQLTDLIESIVTFDGSNTSTIYETPFACEGLVTRKTRLSVSGLELDRTSARTVTLKGSPSVVLAPRQQYSLMTTLNGIFIYVQFMHAKTPLASSAMHVAKVRKF